MTNSEARKRAQAAASQVQGAAEVGADVEALAGLLLWHGRDTGIGRNLGQYRTEYTCDCGETYTSGPGGTDYLTHLASSIINAGWVPPERVAEARAEGVREARLKAEAELEQWKRRMWATVAERATWMHDTGQHAGPLPFEFCPMCERDVARAELERLRIVAEEAIESIGAGGHSHWREGGTGGVCRACEYATAERDRLRGLLDEDGGA